MTADFNGSGSSPEKTRLIEVFLLFLGAFLFLLASSILGNVGGFVGENAGILGIGYLLLAPILVGFKLRSQDKDAAPLVGDTKKVLISCLAVILLVFPVYALLYHGWLKLWDWKPTLLPSFFLADFDEELRGRPKDPVGIALWIEGQRLFIVNHSDRSSQVELDGCSGKAHLVKMTKNGELRALRNIESDTTITISLPTQQGISCDLSGSHYFLASTTASEHGFFVGASSRARGQKVAEERSLRWMLNFLLVQVFGVAFPEEFFFRGYVQTRLRPLFRKRWRLFRTDIGYEVVIASTLFALVHLAGGFSLARLAVFFPGLLFGFLRESTHGILAPTIVHAMSNCVLRLLQRWHGF
jgi:hypothetical protein